MFGIFRSHKCPACGHKMYSDGNNFRCDHCGFLLEVKNKHKSKKPWGYRTAHDRSHHYKESDEDGDV